MQDAKQVAKSKTNHNEVVAVGNSWVVCKSKSYAGRTYYFNTLTGEAAWNLSSAEVAKARKLTKTLSDKSVENIRDCPEPTEPPMDGKSNKETRSQYIYNKKVINNQYTNEPFPMATFVTPQCNSSHLHVMPSCTAGGVNYNPEVWSVPPTHQVFIAPAISPIVNQMQTPVNVQYRDQQNVSVHSSNVPLTRHFNNQNFNYNKTRHASPKYYNRGHTNKFSPRNIRHGHGNFQRKFQDKPNDLRDILSSIRKRRQSHDDVRDNTDVNDSHISSNSLSSIRRRRQSLDRVRDITDADESHNFEDVVSDTPSTSYEYNSDAECNWVEEKKFDIKANMKIDVSCLRDLAPPDADPDRWYIAVDRTILLDHFNYLKMLIDSELDCQLLVPRQELTALQEMSKSRTETPRQVARAKRAYDYVLSQFDDHCAVQGENDILDCCLHLAENNYHVIVLSNNKELQTSSSDIKIFSIVELKAFLTKAKENAPKSSDTPIPPESAIKITIANDFIKDSSACETFESIPIDTKVQQIQDEKEDNSKQNSIDLTSKVIKTQVQQKQDKTEDKSNENSSDVTSNAQPSNNSKRAVTSKDTGVQTDFAAPSKGKIRLKRGTPNQTSTIDSSSDRNTGKKQYRWRGKRNAACDSPNHTHNVVTNFNNISTSTSEDPEKTSDKDTGRGTSQVSVESGQHNYMFYDENVEDSDTSSLCMHRPVSEKIVIDETSTSGVLSNTSASNHDVESVTNELAAQRCRFNREKEEERLRNNYVFEIPSPEVEEHIKTRRDEWVSQFVQIMEEVLSQVLRQNKPTAMHLTPPPWTMQEALQCYLSSNDYYGDVITAANKLSNKISNICDEKGNINIMDLRPSDFMEMYSHGVYLVDALQGQASNCEDLRTAMDLLDKLYKDIQEPNLDASHNDTFGDGEQSHDISNIPHSTGIEHNPITEKVNDFSNVPHSTGIEHDPITEKVNEHTPYNLRSRKSTTSSEQSKRATVKKQKVKRIIDIETSFFKSLNLHKKISQEIDEPSQKQKTSVHEFDNERPSDECDSRYNSGDGLYHRLNSKESNGSGKYTETEFVSQSNCPEFEERRRLREPLDLDQLDYSGNYDDAVNDCYDGELDADQRNLNHEEQKELTEQFPAQSPDINGNTLFSALGKAFVNELRETFIEVLQFCNNSNEQLREPGMSVGKRKSMHEKAKKSHIFVEDIIKYLNSVIHQDNMYQPVNSIQTFLKTADIDVGDLDTIWLSQYRDTIKKCLDQAKILYEAVGVIISATNQ